MDRVSAEDLTAERFYEEYSSKQRPVVITGLQVADPPWTWQEIRTHAGQSGQIVVYYCKFYITFVFCCCVLLLYIYICVCFRLIFLNIKSIVFIIL